MAWIAGVDGCRNGWFIVFCDTAKKDKPFKYKCVDKFEKVMQLRLDFKVITVDMPIGLLSYAHKGGRTCDPIARELLGGDRASSVFTPPVRQALVAKSYEEANQINKDSSPEKLGISQQCYALFPKLREIDDFMKPEFQGIIKEIHPELCFYEMNRGVIKHSKHDDDGIKERGTLLQNEGFADLNIKNIHNEINNNCNVKDDDILDAYAALWTAKRIFEGKAIRIPTDHVRDSHGLLMEMWR